MDRATMEDIIKIETYIWPIEKWHKVNDPEWPWRSS